MSHVVFEWDEEFSGDVLGLLLALDADEEDDGAADDASSAEGGAHHELDDADESGSGGEDEHDGSDLRTINVARVSPPAVQSTCIRKGDMVVALNGDLPWPFRSERFPMRHPGSRSCFESYACLLAFVANLGATVDHLNQFSRSRTHCRCGDSQAGRCTKANGDTRTCLRVSRRSIGR